MSTQTEITRLQSARNTIRTWAVGLGVASSTDKLDTLAEKVSGIANKGAVTASVQEGDSYTIPAGYHNGSGTVTGVSGGGNYNLQTKSVTPTKSQQSIAPDQGYYGLSSVTVAAIPENYNDTSIVTAAAGDVLANKVIVSAAGETITGTMPNNGAVTKVLDATSNNQSYTVPKGYHSGTGTVSISLETKSVTPTKSAQAVTPTIGKVLSSVSVAAIPTVYQDISGTTAAAANVLSGKKFVTSAGVLTDGSMTDNGALALTIDGLTTTSVAIPAGYTSGGTVSLTDDILNALTAI